MPIRQNVSDRGGACWDKIFLKLAFDFCRFFIFFIKKLTLMNTVFALVNDDSWKSVLVENDRILLINKSYSQAEEFIKGYEDESLNRLLKKKKEILFLSISSISHPEKSKDLTITTSDSSTKLEFDNETDMHTVATFIAKHRNLKSNVETMSTFNAIKGPGLALPITVVLGYFMYEEAKIFEAGGEVNTSGGGRRVFYKKLFAFLAEKLGSTGTLIVVGAVALFCIYLIYKRFQKPPNVVVYS